ncbi:acyltransferase [Phascolarctobacterium sp.]|uniref:acyltransferase family protein n=1 Tax=Phascolarctobacterium sp. TaxID=2049039 RepID=UPI0026DC7159|nr:acyltransferase [Phascolarctobacterium sp.]
MGKIVFANSLRGIAAMIVLISHYFDVFYTRPAAVHELLHISHISDSHAGMEFLYKIFNFCTSISYGHLGVAIFFLISGFVIPFSMDKYPPPRKFALNRVLRIYPTYSMALCITVLCIYINSVVYNSEFTIQVMHFIKQIFLVRDLFWIPSIDGVSWTLEIELKFYMISVLFYYFFRQKVYSLIMACICILCSILFVNVNFEEIVHIQKHIVLLDGPIILFMFIGSVFNFMFRDMITYKLGASLILLMLWAFNYTIDNNIMFAAFKSSMFFNYSLALIIFWLCYYKRNSFKNNKILDFLADISFPLYAVHGVMGYSILEFFVLNHWNIYLGVVFTILIVMTTAYLLHRYVEVPTVSLSKQK